MRAPRGLAVLAILLLAASMMPTFAQAASVEDYYVAGGHGLVGRPAGTPVGLVVIAHGYNHTSASHAGHLQHLADQGFLAVAMDFGATPGGFQLGAGAAETKAAIADLDLQVPAGAPRILFSVSMGTTVAGMVLADMPGVFQYWVVSEGLSQLSETWAGAKVLAPVNTFAASAVRDIETECGGTPAEAPLCYQERSAVLRVPEFRGLQGVVVVHGINDGLVPHNQERETATALRAAGIPTDFVMVARGAVGGEGTTLTGYAGQNVDGFAGHGTESNDAHTLTAISFALLDRVATGDLVPAQRESLVDRDAGSVALV